MPNRFELELAELQAGCSALVKELKQKDAMLKIAVEACKLALEFWYSDHPNDTVEGYEAREKIRAAIAKAENYQAA